MCLCPNPRGACSVANLGEKHGQSHDKVLRQLVLVVNLGLPLFRCQHLHTHTHTNKQPITVNSAAQPLVHHDAWSVHKQTPQRPNSLSLSPWPLLSITHPHSAGSLMPVPPWLTWHELWLSMGRGRRAVMDRSPYPFPCASPHGRVGLGRLPDGADCQLDQCALLPVRQHWRKGGGGRREG